MRVLQVAKYYPPAPGGIETFVRDLSHGLVEEGHENLVLAHRFEKTEPRDVSGPMGRVVRVTSFGKVMYAPIAPSYPFRLRTLLRQFKPDMLLIHMPNLSGLWPVVMAIPCPIVIYWHSDVIFPKEQHIHRLVYRAYAVFERLLLQKASRIIATSEPYLEYSEPLRPFRRKCEVIPLGIDPQRIPNLSDEDVAAVKRRVLGDANAKYVYAAGRFAHYKGFDRLLRAAAKTLRTHPDLKYVIAGDGETRSEILRMQMASGLDGHVFLPGRVNDYDYWALMKGCEMFCLPSIERTEAFGVVLLEAMAMGKPCISTDILGSATGWINKCENGIVVPPNNPAELARAISMLSDHRGYATTTRNITQSIGQTAKALATLSLPFAR